MNIHTVKVNGTDYNIAENTAKKQLELYELLAVRFTAAVVPNLQDEVTVDLIKGVLQASPKGTISETADIVLWKCFKAGTSEQVVDIEDFQGSIDGYITLVAEGVAANLQDFFDYLRTQVTLAKEELEKRKAEDAKRL